MKPFYFPTNLFRSSFSLGGKCYKAGREMGEYIGSNGGAVEYPENMITLITRTCSITLQTPQLLSASPPQNYLRAQDSPFSVTNNHSHHCHLPHPHFHRKQHIYWSWNIAASLSSSSSSSFPPSPETALLLLIVIDCLVSVTQRDTPSHHFPLDTLISIAFSTRSIVDRAQ